MKLLRNLLSILVVLAMIGVGVLFALQNEMPVPLDLLSFSSFFIFYQYCQVVYLY